MIKAAALRMLSRRLRVGNGFAASPGRSPSKRKDATGGNQTPLGVLIEEFDYCLDDEEEEMQRRSETSFALWPGNHDSLAPEGAPRSTAAREDLSAEAAMQAFLSRHPSYANDESFAKCRELVAGVRAHGSYKAFAREPHRQFLRLRSLLVRGRAEVRGRSKDSRRLERIAPVPNGACWHVLSSGAMPAEQARRRRRRPRDDGDRGDGRVTGVITN